MNDPRGSIWRKWDLHVHTPYSVLNNGFGDDFDNYVQKLFKSAISNKIAAIGITDYFTIEGYKKIVNEYLNVEEKLKKLFSDEEIAKIRRILILPNIEFRLHDLVNGRRINFHVIMSNEIEIQDIEEHFLHELDFVHESEPFEKDFTRKLKISNLTNLGKKLKEQQPEFSGDDLFVGMATATVQNKEISDKLQDPRFKNKYIIGVPPDEDLSKIEWASQEHMIRKLIIQKSNFLFTSNPNSIKWALGKFNKTTEDYIKEFKSLKPCIWGSDAHDFEKLFEPDLERYCWIKADTTFEGVRQILYEPEERVFIGKEPEILALVRNNPTKYFSKIEIRPVESYNGKNGKWFDNLTIEFNNGLCGIIGNKGKGKSAIADILGLLGDSKVTINDSKDKLFSFLNKSKFCKKGFAENFEAILYWNDNKQSIKQLNKEVDFTEIERIKYIPQKFFEDLCSTEDDEHFKEELNNVVFSRVENKDKLGKNNFNDFVDYKTELIEIEIEKYRDTLKELNVEILELKKKETLEYKTSLENKIKGKQDELDAHNKIKEDFVVVKNPNEDKKLSEEQKLKSASITELAERINELQLRIDESSKKQEDLEIEKFELIRFLEDIGDLEEYVNEWKSKRKEPFKKYEIDVNDVIKFNFNKQQLEIIKNKKEEELKLIENLLSPQSIKGDKENEISLVFQIEDIKNQKAQLDSELEKPFKDYHDFQQLLKDWEIRKRAIEGDKDIPNSLKFFQHEKEYIETNLEKELNLKIELRRNTTSNIYKRKKEIQDIYNSIKKSITDLLEVYSIDQQITLETSFRVEQSFYSIFFDRFIKRYKDFYQNADSFLKELVLSYDFDKEENIIKFINEIR
ncbi:MAG: hypothetical protein HQ541_09240 [Mariniphaga sp.]|nr:hypothetical protein [Mariniphaga sp.]